MTTTPERVMLLIDADNVSVDIMEQAVRLVHQQHGGLHVRRAYCTAESAVKHQTAFKRLGIKPMVNLAAGKNSTDIALAVDAIDLVLAERPDVVVIASSDSDFAPLVQRLREKGCIVRGIGQHGKTGDETRDVYDDYTVLEHRKPVGAADDGTPARKTAPRKTAARKTATAAKTAGKTPAAKKPASKTAEAPPAKKSAAKKTAAAAKAPRKTAARKSTGSAIAGADTAGALGQATAGAVLDEATAAPAAAPIPSFAEPQPPFARPQPASRPASAAVSPTDARPHRNAARGGTHGGVSPAEFFDCLPELAAGQTVALNVAVQRLRESRLLGKNASSSKLFSQLADHVELLPADKPTQVRRRA